MALAGFLKQSTAATLKIGPFVDSTDGVTAETGLTISQADVRLSKNGGNMAQKNEATACTHDEIGVYDCPVDTTDTGTLGILSVLVAESGALPVRHDFLVIPEHVYESLVGNANGPAPLSGLIDAGTAQSAGASSLTLRASFSSTDDVIIGATLYIYSSTNGIHERRVITDWNDTTKVATVDAWTQQPTGTIKYAVYATAPGSTSDPLPVDVTHVNGAAINNLVSGRVDTTVGAMQANVVTSTAINAGAITSAKFAAGAIDATALATGAIDADALAADVATELQSGLATSAEIAAVDAKIDTIDTNVDTINTNVTTLLGVDTIFKKNVAVTAFPFYMELTDGSPGQGLTVSGTISKDGAAFGAISASVVEIASGWYKVDLAQAEMNADFVALKFTATGAKQRNILIKTQS